MRVIEISRPGPPEVLVVASRSRPEPARGKVLIEVRAAGVNRPDVAQRLGKYPPPPGASDVPGLEVAGRIVAAGVIFATFPLERAAEAHALLESGQHVGKIVLTVAGRASSP